MVGSIGLAIPGFGGTILLFFFLFEAITEKFNYMSLLLPVALIGYFLLFGYIWTFWKKRFICWFWVLSATFNLAITILSAGFFLHLVYNARYTLSLSDIPRFTPFFLLPLWTIFVTVFSIKYSFFKPQSGAIDLK